MADLKLKLLATEFDQPLVDRDYVPRTPGQVPTKRYVQGDEFTARDQEEYDHLVEQGAAASPDAPDPRDASQLRGDDLDAALERFGLATDGRADEKRARVQQYLDAHPDASLTPAP